MLLAGYYGYPAGINIVIPLFRKPGTEVNKYGPEGVKKRYEDISLISWFIPPAMRPSWNSSGCCDPGEPQTIVQVRCQDPEEHERAGFRVKPGMTGM